MEQSARIMVQRRQMLINAIATLDQEIEKDGLDTYLKAEAQLNKLRTDGGDPVKTIEALYEAGMAKQSLEGWIEKLPQLIAVRNDLADWLEELDNEMF